MKIKRRTSTGIVKSVDGEKKLLVIAEGKDAKAKDLLVDVGPSLIKAGKGGATFADIKAGDKISVWGEVMAKGGLRAMEITLPPSRMSIPPPQKPAKQPKEKKERKVKGAPKSPAGEKADGEKADGKKDDGKKDDGKKDDGKAPSGPQQ